MNINYLTRPLGFANGGDTIVQKPKPKPDIKPKEKPVNINRILAEFDTPENKAGPGERSMISKILNIGDPVIDREFQFKEILKPVLKTIMKSSPTLSAAEGLAGLLMKEAGAAEIEDLSSLTDNQLLNNYISDMNFFILEGGDPKLLPDYIQKQRNELVSRGVID